MLRDIVRFHADRASVRGMLVAFAGFITAICAPAGALAQDTGGGNANQLEEVTVTATRREESVQRVPISIEAFGQEDLASGYIKSIDDISALSPGLQFAVPNGFSSAFTTIAIRGLNTNTGPPTVGLYLDDTVISSRLSGTANQGNVYPIVWDMDRVEVLRGPQGTLFGAGAEAGTVRFISNQPSLSNYTGLARGEIASTEGGRMSYATGVAFGGPIIEDQLGFRVSAWDSQDGGWVNRVDPTDGGALVAKNANTMSKWAVRTALAFKVGDFLVTPSVYYQSVHQDDARRFYENYSNADQGIFNNGVLLPEVWTDKWIVYALKGESHLPFADLTANTSYLDRSATEVLDESAFVCPGIQFPEPGPGVVTKPGCGSPTGITGLPSLPSQVAYTPTNLYVRAYTGEVRLASNHPEDRIGWVTGLYYEHRKQRDFQTDYDPYAYQQAFPTAPACDPAVLPSCIIQDQHELFIDVQSAVFAQVDFHVTDKLTATVGERYAKVKVDGALTTSITALTGAPAYAPFSASTNPLTPHLGLSYQLDHDNLVYATFSEGYRPGGGNSAIPNTTGFCAGVPQVQPVYNPDNVHAYEIGAKDTVLGGRLQANTSVFYNEWNNIQQYVSESCGPYAYGTNGGNAVSKGFDLQARALLTDKLKAELNVAYVDAYYTQSAYVPGQGPGQVPNPASIVLAGDKVGILPQVNPPWNVVLALDYDLPLSNGNKFHAWANAIINTRNPGPFITQNTTVNFYALAVPDPTTYLYNARFGYMMNKLDVSLFINNIANNTPALSKYQANPNSTLISYTTFVPRTIGVTANYSF
ncbi:MAG: TonB-dependent receptor [Gammaproteobacteria bacterium]|nr:TonB-dependent receptor [Gammaproteobacteria bacterium]